MPHFVIFASTGVIPFDMQDSKEQLFDSIFTANYRGLIYFATLFLKDKMLAEDVVQDVFVKVWNNLEAFGNLKAAKPYLYKCVRNLCIDERLRMEQTNVPFPSPEQQLSYILDAETLSLIYEAVNKLPEGTRKVMTLVLHGKKNAEIARELNMSSNTVRTHKQRAVIALRKHLKPDIFLPLMTFMLERW